MNTIVHACLLLCVLAASVFANSDGPPVPNVAPMADIYLWNKGYLKWEWLPAVTGSPISEYVLNCRQGATLVVKRFAGTVMETPMKDLGATGDWTCTMKAMSGAVEVATSNEYPFVLVGELRLGGVSK